jgi:hypothetical protein
MALRLSKSSKPRLNLPRDLERVRSRAMVAARAAISTANLRPFGVHSWFCIPVDHRLCALRYLTSCLAYEKTHPDSSGGRITHRNAYMSRGRGQRSNPNLSETNSFRLQRSALLVRYLS